MPKGDYRQTKGVISEQKIATKRFRKFDKVLYLVKEYFIKGRTSTGHAILMDIEGKKTYFKNIPKGIKQKRGNIKC